MDLVELQDVATPPLSVLLAETLDQASRESMLRIYAKNAFHDNLADVFTAPMPAPHPASHTANLRPEPGLPARSLLTTLKDVLSALLPAEPADKAGTASDWSETPSSMAGGSAD